MQDKIIVAIAAYLEKETGFSEDYRKVTFAKRLPAKMGKDEFCKNRATEIAAAIAPLVEAGDVDDSQYTDDFLKWREKYFSKAKPETKQFVSKNMGVYFSHLELESKYERAMNGFKAKK